MKNDVSTAYPPDFTDCSVEQFVKPSFCDSGLNHCHSEEEKSLVELKEKQPTSQHGLPLLLDGCAFWETLLEGDGQSDLVANPRQEISTFFATILPKNLRLLEQAAEDRYEELFRKYQTELAESETEGHLPFTHFLQETKHLFEDAATVPLAIKDSILQFIIVALHTAEREVADPLLDEAHQKLKSQLEKWQEKALTLANKFETEELPLRTIHAKDQSCRKAELSPSEPSRLTELPLMPSENCTVSRD